MTQGRNIIQKNHVENKGELCKAVSYLKEL